VSKTEIQIGIHSGLSIAGSKGAWILTGFSSW
jgi:hypothetical protein